MVDVDIRKQHGKRVYHADNIRAALADGPLTLRGISDVTGIAYNTLDTTVRRMIRKGQVMRLAWGVYAIPEPPFRSGKTSVSEIHNVEKNTPFYGVVSELSACPRSESKTAFLGDFVTENVTEKLDRIEALLEGLIGAIQGNADNSDAHIQARLKNTPISVNGGNLTELSEMTVTEGCER